MARTISCLAGAALLLAASAANAQSTGGYYISGEGGASFLPYLHLNDTTTGQQHEHFDNGYALGGAFGYDFGNGQRVELDSLYTHSALKSIDGVSAQGHLHATSLMANAQMDLVQDSPITPYIGAGLGAENIGGHVGDYEGHQWKPAYQAEAGLRDDVSPEFSLFGEYRFSQAEAAKFSNGFDQAHQHYSDHALLAGLTYHLGSW